MQLSPLYEQRLAEAFQQGFQEALQQRFQQGVQAERRKIIESLLRVRFGTLDKPLAAIVTAMLGLPPEEYTPLLLQLSRSELLTKFSQNN